MILGLPSAEFVFVHVVLSIAALVTGGIVLLGLLSGRPLTQVTAAFLLVTLLANVTGLLFPFTKLGPGHIVGAASVLVFAPTAMALYRFRLAGIWSSIHVIGATFLVWANSLIAVRQAFAKLDYLQPLQDTPVPHVAQLALLALFAMIGTLADDHMTSVTGWSRDKLRH